ncbi:GGDEF domain-containing protein [Aureimonas ureilytica]|uniref:GGDEF domain-containing protein n=1 Tax=Aureimonas ureilytica TaxID=401562 RepID=UPI003CF527C3
MQLNDRLAALAAHTGALIAIYDPDGRVAYANEAFRGAFFLEPDETPLWVDLMRRNHAARRGPRVSHPDFEFWLSSCLSRRGTMPSLSMETDLLDGRWLSITESTMPDGWMLFVGCDVTRQRQTDRLLRQERDIAWKFAHTDELTGISNRRHVHNTFSALVERGRGIDAPLGCVALLDIDFFKQINDRFGHQVGDDVLVEIARRIPSLLRTCDAFGRMGGEEFMLILPHVTAEEGLAILGRVLDHLRESRFVPDDPTYRVTCSAGFTTIHPGEPMEALYPRVDRALYEAKRTGRDRIVTLEREPTALA